MRLDHFLPFLSRGRAAYIGKARPLYARLRRWLPRGLVSDEAKRQSGWGRWLLRRMGPSWVAAPLRRAVQGVFLGLFLWLFFWVCWPYRAEPAPVWPGWVPAEVDVSTGRLRLSTGTAVPEDLAVRLAVHVADETGKDWGLFEVTERAVGGITLVPQERVAATDWEELSFRVGPWSLSTRSAGEWPSHYAADFAARDGLPAEFFLIIDPLVSLSTAVAARSWVWSLSAAALILLVCVLIPRGFCGYLCPLGTMIDLFDWTLGKRVTRFRVGENGWWVHLKYYILLGVLVAAAGGVLLSGVVAAIPVVTRGLLYIAAPVQAGLARGWRQVPPWDAGQLLSIALFAGVFLLGLLKPRFWCKYVCPSGAVFSVGNLFRVSERKVEDTCIHCNKCVEICPFDAIKADFTTRTTDCTLCQTCGGVCPTHSIKFVERSNGVRLKAFNVPPTGDFLLGRRTFLASGVGMAAGACGGVAGILGMKTLGAKLSSPGAVLPVRPPGSVPEGDFLQLCIRCGECFKVCPNNVLQPLGFQQGLEGLWSPYVAADWAGCEPSCNACGPVCPTGAIHALPLEEKRHARMGLAIVDEQTCLPIAGKEACQLCVDECNAAGYHAIDLVRVTQNAAGLSGPRVDAQRCVGCGLCQTRCFSVNAKDKKLLSASAIVIKAGPGREDRWHRGSYKARRASGPAQGADSQPAAAPSYLPEFLQEPEAK